jgi:hypothetical protein
MTFEALAIGQVAVPIQMRGPHFLQPRGLQHDLAAAERCSWRAAHEDWAVRSPDSLTCRSPLRTFCLCCSIGAHSLESMLCIHMPLYHSIDCQDQECSSGTLLLVLATWCLQQMQHAHLL